MPSTYTVNLGIEKPATGEQSGTWGDTTNVNFDILDQAINGAERVTLTSAGSSGSPNSLQITNGATSDGRNKWLEFYSSSDLGGSAYVQLDPNDAEKIVFVRNSLAGSQSVILFQGTYNAARDLEVPAGVDMVVKFDGGGASAATVTDVFTKLRATEITTPTLTAGTADINGGTVDGAVIGGSSAAAITGTTVTANTSLNIAGDGATVTGIKDEDDMSSNSPTKLATQQSIKAYVDSQVGTVDTWAEVLANGATSGSTNPEVTAGQAIKTNTINETTAGSGVTIDSVLLKDDSVNAATLEVTTLKANDGTAAGSIADSTGVVTLNSVDINGGNIDGTTIGATTTSNGSFSTLTGATINATSVVDTPDIETARISARDGTTAINIADTTGAVDIDTSLNVDGTITGDGLTVDGDVQINSTFPRIFMMESDTTDKNSAVMSSSGDFKIFTVDDAKSVFTQRFNIDHTTGDITFYDGANSSFVYDANSGTTINNNQDARDFTVKSDNNAAMLYVDGTNDKVGVGTLSVNGNLTTKAINAAFDDDANETTYGRVALQIQGADDVTNDVNSAIIFSKSGSRKIAGIAARQFNDPDQGGLDFYTQPSSSGSAASLDLALQLANDGYMTTYSGAEFNVENRNSDFVINGQNNDNVFVVNADSDEVVINGTTGLSSAHLTVWSDEVDAYSPSTINDGGGLALYKINNDNTDNDSIALRFRVTNDSGSSNADGAITYAIKTTGDHDGFMAFQTRNTGGTRNEQLRLDSQNGFHYNSQQVSGLDFKVSSDNQEHMLFVDASTDRVGVGASAPQALLDVEYDNATLFDATDDSAQRASTATINVTNENGTTNTFAQIAFDLAGSGQSIARIAAIRTGTSDSALSFVTEDANVKAEKLRIEQSGELTLESNAALHTLSTASSATTEVTVYQFSATTYTGAKLLVCVTDSTATERYITEILVTHDGTTAVSTEYGQVATDTALSTFDVDISSGFVRLRATPASSNSMTFKIMSTQLLA